jgi:hypothetical protein
LEDTATHLERDEARAMASLLESLLSLKGTGSMAKVIDSLEAKVQVRQIYQVMHFRDSFLITSIMNRNYPKRLRNG